MTTRVGGRWAPVAGLLLTLGCGAASEAPTTTATAPDEISPAASTGPDLAELRALLVPHTAHPFDSAAQARGCPSDASLGQYVELLVSTTTPEPGSSDVVRLTGGCAEERPARVPLDPPLDPAYWDCRIDAYASDGAGESPWHYELRLRVRRADSAVDLDHLACPGGS